MVLSSIFRLSSLIRDDNTLGIRHLFLLGEFKGIIDSNNPHSMETFIKKNETLFIKKIVLGNYHCNLLHILCYGVQIPFNPPDFVNSIVNIKDIIKKTIFFFEKHYSCFEMIPETYFMQLDSNGNTPLDIAHKLHSLKIQKLFCKRFGGEDKAIDNEHGIITSDRFFINCENSASKTQSAGTKKRKYSKKKRNTYKRKFKNIKKKNK